MQGLYNFDPSGNVKICIVKGLIYKNEQIDG
jgi:hypothetical protein